MLIKLVAFLIPKKRILIGFNDDDIKFNEFSNFNSSFGNGLLPNTRFRPIMKIAASVDS